MSAIYIAIGKVEISVVENVTSAMTATIGGMVLLCGVTHPTLRLYDKAVHCIYDIRLYSKHFSELSSIGI